MKCEKRELRMYKIECKSYDTWRKKKNCLKSASGTFALLFIKTVTKVVNPNDLTLLSIDARTIDFSRNIFWKKH